MQIDGVKVEFVNPAVQALSADADRLPPAFPADKVALVSLNGFLADLIEREPPTHNYRISLTNRATSIAENLR